VRAVCLTPAFQRIRSVHAPPGSAEYDAVHRVLMQLANERRPLPAPDDQEALRTPIETIWARRVPGADLVVTYSILPLMIEVRSVHPAW
jgi:hypothetical protein